MTVARVAVIACLILAGECVFSLPFHVTRFFRATTLEVFGFSNAQLGDIFAVYGGTAIFLYLVDLWLLISNNECRKCVFVDDI